MKRAVCVILTLLLCLGAAHAEPVLYDDQGGVRVFAEDGRAGLMDAAGRVLLPAEYDVIEPFGETDFTVARAGDRKDVVDRTGRVILSGKWASLVLYPEARIAVAYREYEDQTVFDLDTGEAWLRGKYDFSAEGAWTIQLAYEDANWGFTPPFHTRVYDLHRQLVWEADARLARVYDNGWVCWHGRDDRYSVQDTAGRTIAEGLSFVPGVDTAKGLVHYVNYREPALNDWLRPFRLDREHLLYYLKRWFGIDGSVARALTWPLKRRPMCGVVDAGGHRVEARGWSMLGPDSAGLYRVEAEIADWWIATEEREIRKHGYLHWDDGMRWGYMDGAGRWAILPIYDDAYDFVDGAAVVGRGETMRLIDGQGRQVGDLEWTWPAESWTNDVFGQAVVPVLVGGRKYRFARRDGTFVSEDEYGDVGGFFAGWFLLTDAMGRPCLMDGTGERVIPVSDGPWEGCQYFAADMDTLWVRAGGLYRAVSLSPDDAGAALPVEPCARVEYFRDGVYALLRPDGSAVYGDTGGRVYGPATLRPELQWDDF